MGIGIGIGTIVWARQRAAARVGCGEGGCSEGVCGEDDGGEGGCGEDDGGEDDGGEGGCGEVGCGEGGRVTVACLLGNAGDWRGAGSCAY